MQMMHADVCGFLVPPLLYSMSCALGMREDSAAFLCVAVVFSNLGIPLCQEMRRGHFPNLLVELPNRDVAVKQLLKQGCFQEVT